MDTGNPPVPRLTVIVLNDLVEYPFEIEEIFNVTTICIFNSDSRIKICKLKRLIQYNIIFTRYSFYQPPGSLTDNNDLVINYKNF